METIELNDRTQLTGHIIPNGDDTVIFVYLTGLSLADGFSLFSNGQNLTVIRENNHGTEHVYRGFTQMTAISAEFGNCNITLRKP